MKGLELSFGGKEYSRVSQNIMEDIRKKGNQFFMLTQANKSDESVDLDSVFKIAVNVMFTQIREHTQMLEAQGIKNLERKPYQRCGKNTNS